MCALLVAAVASVSPALAAAPEAPVAEAQSHTATSAFLQGVLNPGAEPPQEGTYEFLYAVSPTPCTGESKGTRGLTFGFNGQEVGEEIGGLSPHTTYTVCLLARNLAGEETLSTPESFRTSFEPEAPETAAADAISTSNAMLHGTLNPNSSREEEPGFYEFLYKHSANECEGEGSTGQLPAITGQEKEAVQAEITGLAPGAQYTVCLRAWNATGQFAQGAPVTFRTEPEAPAVSEESASSVSARSAHVSAQLNTGGLPVTYTVQYGTTTSYGSETEPVEVSASVTSIPASLTGLQPGTEYHYRFEVTNTQGELQGSDASFATAPGTSEAPASEGNCPNEQIRKEQGSQFLPECRAYEMVSPSYKEGYGTATGPNSFSSNGERAIIRSFATLAGVQGEGEIPFGGAFYLDTRTANGWRLSPINPPQSQLAGQILVAPEADDGESLWVAHTLDKPGSARELYLGSASGLGST
ncbi:MAG: fibronectin type III domain-containing protein, partial [Solirubrobacteraceae bacterium]